MQEIPYKPFILRFAEPVTHTTTPGYYDRDKQLWVTPKGMADRTPEFTIRTSAPEKTDEIDQGTGI